jgi:hypothetical protein
MPAIPRSISLCLLLVTGGLPLAAQTRPVPGDSQHSLVGDAALGLLPASAGVPDTQAQHGCLPLPVDPPNDRLEGPHGDSLVATHCQVVKYQPLTPDSAGSWFTAQYRWTSLFTAEDTTRGPTARDTVTEDEVVVIAAPRPGQVRPVWHARFETGDYAIWRSVTPELAVTTEPSTLLSVMSCVNGTGGCSQEFLQRHPDGHWAPVRQVWLDQLPRGFADRLLHGVRIDPRTLRGEAGFYGESDPNCCPSEELRFQLGLHGDSLVLRQHAVVSEPQR